MVDYRALKWIEGNTESLVKHLTCGLAPDYDGLNDYYELRKALSMAMICGKALPTGEQSTLSLSPTFAVFPKLNQY